MADVAGDLTNRVAPRKFATLYRLRVDLSWEDSMQYDDRGRAKVVEYVRATAGARLLSEIPEVGWVGPSGEPCGEFRMNAKPAWIWWTE